MEQTIVVIDDFYENPDEMRRFALGGDYKDISHATNKGYNGLYFHPGQEFVHNVMCRIAKCLRFPILYDPDPNHVRKQAGFKILTEEKQSAKTSLVHVDYTRWAGVLNMTPPPAPRLFTSFWKYKEWDLEGFHDREAMKRVIKKYGIKPADLEKVFEHSADLSKWEEVDRVYYKFNRLILFSGNMFHVSGPGYGNSIETAKMTQTFFFEERTDEAEKRLAPAGWRVAV
ncbi:MAG TPA: DUF6445 family protein [Bdellovibrionales bacterium]|nr:DUF6445 family protein [Bdellovibrionales bacterium]